MMKSKIFTSIFYLEIEGECSEIVLENLNIIITNNIKPIQEIFSDEQCRMMIGFNEAHSLENSKCIFYQQNSSEVHFEEFDERAFLINTLIHLQMFYHALWLVKDNAIHCELAYLIYEDEKQRGIHSNLWTSFYTDSLGKLEDITFTIDEIKTAIALYQIVLKINRQDTPIVNSAIKLTSKTSRLSRAFYFVHSARTAVDIGTKISLYCSVLESIFSVSNTELKHRLSETVAFFLETTVSGKKTVYKSLQNAYDIRSAVVHGDGIQLKFLKNEAKLLLETVKETDDIIRKCLRKIFDDQKLYELFTIKEREEISTYLQDLIFSNVA
jgi:hypothetical protein